MDPGETRSVELEVKVPLTPGGLVSNEIFVFAHPQQRRRDVDINLDDNHPLQTT